MGFFGTVSHGGGGGSHHSFVVIALMIMKFGTDIKLEVILHSGNKKVCDITIIA